MSRYILIGLVMMWAGAAMGQSGWVMQTSGTGQNLTAVDFVSAMNGVAVGDARTILRTTDGGSTWTAVNAGTGSRLDAVSFADDSFGVAVGEEGQVLRTQNGGLGWSVIRDGWMDELKTVQQRTRNSGVAMGVNTLFQPFGLTTTDGWESNDGFSFYVDHGGSGNEGTVTGVHFFNDTLGCAAVDVWDGHGAVVKTTNGGANWTTTYWDVYALNALATPQNGTHVLYAGGLYGVFLTSADSGSTWNALPQQDIDIYGLCFVNADTGWIVGAGGRVKRTTGGGLGWQDQSNPAGPVTLRGVDFANDSVGYIVGDGGVVLKTTTGGEISNHAPGEFARVEPVDSSFINIGLPPAPPLTFRWTTAHDPDGDTVRYHVRVWDDPVYLDFTATDTVLTDSLAPLMEMGYSVLLLHVQWSVYATDGQDSVAASNGTGHFNMLFIDAVGDGPRPTPKEYSLSAYPNPFNPTTTIAFTLPQAGEVKLSVFNVEGREVFTQRFGTLSAGEHRVQFDGAQLSSGVYISRLETARGQISRKLVLMK
jgi:photosystem II stability/assembly factor-like uncharacterized protein